MNFTHLLKRTLSQVAALTTMVQCSFPSFSEATKLPYLLGQAITNIGPFMAQLATFTTFDGLIVQDWFSLELLLFHMVRLY